MDTRLEVKPSEVDRHRSQTKRRDCVLFMKTVDGVVVKACEEDEEGGLRRAPSLASN